MLLQTVIAAYFADEQVTAMSHRIGFDTPGRHDHCYDGQPVHIRGRQETPTLIEQLAAPALPARMRNLVAACGAE